MNIPSAPIQYRRLTTPRAAAIAGILFGVLFAISLALMRTALPEVVTSDLNWITKGAPLIKLSLALVPFAGIAYLWFLGVVRDRLGEYEDRFFSTIFFGSSLLFLGTVFVSTAIAGGLLATSHLIIMESSDYSVIFFGRAVMLTISNVFALRMAGVTMISLATIWLRTGLMPRWLTVLTYVLALALLVVVNYSFWITLIFPVWVTLISLFILWMQRKQPAGHLSADTVS